MKFYFTIKCILLGDSQVGKSSILTQYIQDRFFLNPTSTIGVDFGIKEMDIKYGANDYNIKFNIWDTAGDNRYKSIVETYYRNTSYILLTFDVNKRCSFNNIVKLYYSIKNDHEKSKFIFVGNKTDLNNNYKVNEKEVSKLAKELDIQYIFISAKECSNVHELFKLVYTDALKEFDKLAYIKKIDCKSFNNIKVRNIPEVYVYNKEVESCWCGFCKVC